MKTRERVDLDLIDDNPWQPRQAIGQEGLQELAESIKQLGLLQAPLGRRVEGGRVQLAFGHRRVVACRLLHGQGAGLPHVDMDLADLSDEAMAVMGLTENELRKQLTQIEVVRAHKKAIEETALTVAELARQLGMDRASLSNNLRVLELPDLVLEHVESGALGLTVAREFLVFQDSAHVHTEDMRKVVERIVTPYRWSDELGGPPDWRRRNVRKMISGRVEGNEEDWRPLGPRPKYINAGGYREASFDVEAFTVERPRTLHTIPSDMLGDGNYAGSRVWTCDVKTWRSWQTRATREANKEEAAAGGPSAATPAKGVSLEKQFEKVLASDSVWKKIAVSRETSGPVRPVTEEEKTALGTRVELRDVPSYNAGFYKKLNRGNPDYVHDWDRDSGGFVPPWFPDLKECQKCTIGAAYAKSRNGYPLEKITLCCFNQGPLQGEAAGRRGGLPG